MAVPKRKSSKARKNKRRSNVWKLDAPAAQSLQRKPVGAIECNHTGAVHRLGCCFYRLRKCTHPRWQDAVGGVFMSKEAQRDRPSPN